MPDTQVTPFLFAHILAINRLTILWEGSLNISARSLTCLPSSLFEIHLGVKPDPLKLVPEEPPLPDDDTPVTARRAARSDNPSWFEAQDLHVLKAWSNDIVEIQPEISLFGSLKTVDVCYLAFTSIRL